MAQASPDRKIAVPLKEEQGKAFQHFFLPPATSTLPTIAGGEGVYLWDDTGRRYLDVTSGPVVSNLGHGNERVLAAMTKQARQATFAWPLAFESKANRALAAAVTRAAGPGLERAFFVSGGSEAIEGAIKFARQYAVVCGDELRSKVISRHPSYHGGTLGALAVSGDVAMDRLFGPLARLMPKVPAPLSYRFPSGFDRESYALAAAEALEEEILAQGPETVLAFILEPVGGLATGALVAPEAYYLKVREICDRYGVLLIYDEVMSGAGRTGAFLAAHHWPDARPDLVVLAKGIGAGYTPLGIFLAPEDFVETLVCSGGFQHGHTYNANPLTCAVGLAVLQEVEERGLIENAKVMGELLAEQLGQVMAASPIVGDLRGKGLLLALEIVADKTSKAMLPADCNALARIVALAREEGLLLYTRRTNEGRFGEWLMIAPPLIVSAEEVGAISEGLGRVLARYCDELSGAGLL